MTFNYDRCQHCRERIIRSNRRKYCPYCGKAKGEVGEKPRWPCPDCGMRMFHYSDGKWRCNDCGRIQKYTPEESK